MSVYDHAHWDPGDLFFSLFSVSSSTCASGIDLRPSEVMVLVPWDDGDDGEIGEVDEVDEVGDDTSTIYSSTIRDAY